MRIDLLTAFLVLSGLGSACAYTLDSVNKIATTTGTSTDVQNAINDASVVDTWTVAIPAGDFTWTTGITVSKGVYIKGAGQGFMKGVSFTSVTVGTGSKVFTVTNNLGFVAGETIEAVLNYSSSTASMRGTVTSYSGTTLTINVTSTTGSGTHAQWNFRQTGATKITYSGAGTAINITEDATHNIKVRYIHAVVTGTGNFVEISGNGKPVVVGQMRFVSPPVANPSREAIKFDGPASHGVIHDCSFDTDFEWPTASGGSPCTGCRAFVTRHAIYMPSVSQATWTTVTPHGTNDVNGDGQVYVERCHFQGFYTECLDLDGGVMMVFRNNVVDCSGITSHGADTGQPFYGIRWFECYSNVFTYFPGPALKSPVLDYFIYFRGGAHLMAGNIFPVLDCDDYSPKSPIKYIIQYLQRDSGVVGCWGGGYPAPRQVGMGRVTGTGTTGDIGNSQTGYYGDLETCYFWGNSGGGQAYPAMNDYGTCPPQTTCCSPAGPSIEPSGGLYVIEGRDWSNNVAKPNWVAYNQGAAHPLSESTNSPSSDPGSGVIARTGPGRSKAR